MFVEESGNSPVRSQILVYNPTPDSQWSSAQSAASSVSNTPASSAASTPAHTIRHAQPRTASLSSAASDKPADDDRRFTTPTPTDQKDTEEEQEQEQEQEPFSLQELEALFAKQQQRAQTKSGGKKFTMSWGDMVMGPATQVSYRRGRSLHDKLSSPDRGKRRSSQEVEQALVTKHKRAEQQRQQQIRQMRHKLREHTTRAAEVSSKQAHNHAKRVQETVQQLEERLEKAEQVHESHLQQIRSKAGSENQKVDEVAFITSMDQVNSCTICGVRLVLTVLCAGQPQAGTAAETATQRKAAEQTHSGDHSVREGKWNGPCRGCTGTPKSDGEGQS